MRTTSIRWLAFVLFLAAGVAGADRESSQFFGQRAEKALVARNWAEAEQLYRRALEEDATFLPARFGLAEALLGAGQRGPGVEELRRFCDEATKVNPLPTAWAPTLAKARKRLGELDTLGGEWEKLVTEQVNTLLAFATRWKERDRKTAVRALERIVALRPGHAKALELLSELQGGDGTAWTPLFNGKDKTGWTRAGAPIWSVEFGQLQVHAKEGGYVATTEMHFKGDFDVRMEARRIEPLKGGYPMLALAATYKEERVKALVGLLEEELVVREYDGGSEHRKVLAAAVKNLQPPLDPTAWNLYELRYRKERIHALVNGKEVAVFPRGPLRDAGYVGLQVQYCHAAIRRVEYVQR